MTQKTIDSTPITEPTSPSQDNRLVVQFALAATTILLCIVLVIWGIHRVQISDPYVHDVLASTGDLERGQQLFWQNCRNIVLSLRNFARPDQAKSKLVDIHEGIDSTLLILRHRLKPYDNFPGIEVTKHYGDLPRVSCYPSQLNQVFMNLLANAIDVLEAPPLPHSPAITIYTRQIGPNRIQIRFTDNGPGIIAKIRNKLFDPFFTTKDVGKGTGLGLSISYQIITERHNGSLSCRSELGQGTSFVIEIPIRQDDFEGYADG